MEPKLQMDRQDLDAFFASLQTSGYEILGPAVVDGAIAYRPLDSAHELPAGWTDEQEGGHYRLKETNDGALFGYSVAQQSWKQFLFLPTLRLWRADRNGSDFQTAASGMDVRKRAFVGVRACEIMAMEIQDRILMEGPYSDAVYAQLRSNTLIVAVQCRKAGGTCFCVSMNSGPGVTRGFDISLTEIVEPGRHLFVVERGTEKGSEILDRLRLQPAGAQEIAAVDRLLSETARHMGRVLDQTGVKELLYRSYEHPRWFEVARRCLTCTNCTIVCPTCFCANVEDTIDLTGTRAERWRRWDSCFTLDHSSIHGGCVRCTSMSRYRQWMTHKLATWIDQFGTSGCVGCGRCITWCPVGIDITEETEAIRSSGDAAPSPFGNKGD